MNVWANNNDNRNKTVIVYIHGGAFVSGGSSAEVYAGEFIVRQDTVYISIIYLLGIFGFLASEELSAESDS
ncbi:carboxylesterase family protein [Paenibacillus amylolyticus]|uniref:carboxylesterase family protein n=1 Tax=Paenibacillus amylolyticus TaxID=1451 RepID=UPI003D6BB8E9